MHKSFDAVSATVNPHRWYTSTVFRGLVLASLLAGGFVAAFVQQNQLVDLVKTGHDIPAQMFHYPIYAALAGMVAALALVLVFMRQTIVAERLANEAFAKYLATLPLDQAKFMAVSPEVDGQTRVRAVSFLNARHPGWSSAMAAMV